MNKEQYIYPIKIKKMPPIFELVRGSSSGVYCPEDNTIWFIVHIVSYDTPRHYYHMFVKFDMDMNLLRYSSPWIFDTNNSKLPGSIQYSLSFLIETERILINFSIQDSTTDIGIYDRKYIENMLIYMP